MTTEDGMGAWHRSEDMTSHRTAVVAILNSRERTGLTVRERTNTNPGIRPPDSRRTFLRWNSVRKTGAGTTRIKSVTGSQGETKTRISTNQTRVGQERKIREGGPRRKTAIFALA